MSERSTVDHTMGLVIATVVSGLVFYMLFGRPTPSCPNCPNCPAPKAEPDRKPLLPRPLKGDL